MDIIAIILTPLLYTNIIKYFLSIYQQQYYKSSRYIQCLIKNINKKELFKKSVLIIGYALLSLCFIYFFKAPTYLIFLYTLIALMLLSTQKDYIIPLKYTARIKRSFLVHYFVMYILLLFVYLRYNQSNYMYLLYNIILLSLTFLFTMFVMIILHPIEQHIRNKYALKAKLALLENKKLTTIGITGSYGKTSTKNILNKLLASKYNVLSTPKSYNTPMGISNCINNEKMYLYDFFIAEMGIDEAKGMDRLLNIVSPSIAIITSIGPMHLKTFKNMKRLIDEKMKLALSIPEDGFVIINNDNEYIRNYDKSKIKGKIITIGFHNDADVMAHNINFDNYKYSFDVSYKDDLYHLELPLVGEHNVTNALLAIATSIILGVEKEKIIEACSTAKSIPHRLEVQRRDTHLIIDDSYNSNFEGFSNALDVLSKYKEKRILITPGLIELGKYNKEYNSKIAEKIVTCCDEIILVKNKSSQYIKQRINKMSINFPVIEVDSFFEANKYICREYNNKEVVVLIENDLPDNFLN